MSDGRRHPLYIPVLKCRKTKNTFACTFPVKKKKKPMCKEIGTKENAKSTTQTFFHQLNCVVYFLIASCLALVVSINRYAYLIIQ